MISKNITVPDDAKAIILDMDWFEVEGQTVGRIARQLDRETYVKVSKYLELLGGKWDKRKQYRGHVFAADPRPALRGIEENGSFQFEQYDAFYTPIDVVQRMVNLARFERLNLDRAFMLEPSAGSGRIIVAVHERYPAVNVHYCELNEQAFQALRKLPGRTVCVGRDFLEVEGHVYDRVLMNPPFSRNQWKHHIEHAWSLLKPGGILVSVVPGQAAMREEWESGFDADFDAYDLPDGTFKESGTGVATHLLVLRKAAEPCGQLSLF